MKGPQNSTPSKKSEIIFVLFSAGCDIGDKVYLEERRTDASEAPGIPSTDVSTGTNRAKRYLPDAEKGLQFYGS